MPISNGAAGIREVHELLQKVWGDVKKVTDDHETRLVKLEGERSFVKGILYCLASIGGVLTVAGTVLAALGRFSIHLGG